MSRFEEVETWSSAPEPPPGTLGDSDGGSDNDGDDDDDEEESCVIHRDEDISTSPQDTSRSGTKVKRRRSHKKDSAKGVQKRPASPVVGSGGKVDSLPRSPSPLAPNRTAPSPSPSPSPLTPTRFSMIDDADDLRRRAPTINLFTTTDWGSLSEKGNLKTFQKGDVIVEEGKHLMCLYRIKSGRVQRTKRDGDQTVNVAILGRKETFGESSVLGHVAVTSEIAKSDVEVWEITPRHIYSSMNEDPYFAERFFKLCCMKLALTLSQFNAMVMETVVKSAISGQSYSSPRTSTDGVRTAVDELRSGHHRRPSMGEEGTPPLIAADSSESLQRIRTETCAKRFDKYKKTLSLPDNEMLLDSFKCTMNGVSGKLVISRRFVSFVGRFLTSTKKIIIPYSQVVLCGKNKDVSLDITTPSKTHACTFHSASIRDDAYSLITEASGSESKDEDVAGLLKARSPTFADSDMQISMSPVRATPGATASPQSPTGSPTSKGDDDGVARKRRGAVSNLKFENATATRKSTASALTEYRRMQMTNEYFELILQGATTRTFEKDAVIVQQGNRVSSVFQVVHGSVRIEQLVVADSKETVHIQLNKLYRNDTFGEMTFILGSESPVSIVADSDMVEIYVIDGQFLEELFRNRREISAPYYKTVAQLLESRLQVRTVHSVLSITPSAGDDFESPTPVRRARAATKRLFVQTGVSSIFAKIRLSYETFDIAHLTLRWDVDQTVDDSIETILQEANIGQRVPEGDRKHFQLYDSGMRQWLKSKNKLSHYYKDVFYIDNLEFRDKRKPPGGLLKTTSPLRARNTTLRLSQDDGDSAITTPIRKQICVKLRFPSPSFPMLFTTVQLDRTLTCKEAVHLIEEIVNVPESAGHTLFDAEQQVFLDNDRTLIDIFGEEVNYVTNIEFLDKESSTLVYVKVSVPLAHVPLKKKTVSLSANLRLGEAVRRIVSDLSLDKYVGINYKLGLFEVGGGRRGWLPSDQTFSEVFPGTRYIENVQLRDHDVQAFYIKLSLPQHFPDGVMTLRVDPTRTIEQTVARVIFDHDFSKYIKKKERYSLYDRQLKEWLQPSIQLSSYYDGVNFAQHISLLATEVAQKPGLKKQSTLWKLGGKKKQKKAHLAILLRNPEVRRGDTLNGWVFVSVDREIRFKGLEMRLEGCDCCWYQIAAENHSGMRHFLDLSWQLDTRSDTITGGAVGTSRNVLNKSNEGNITDTTKKSEILNASGGGSSSSSSGLSGSSGGASTTSDQLGMEDTPAATTTTTAAADGLTSSQTHSPVPNRVRDLKSSMDSLALGSMLGSADQVDVALAAGEYCFPFSWDVPVDLPLSFRIGADKEFKRGVSYRLSSQITGVNSELKSSEPFTVTGTRPWHLCQTSDPVERREKVEFLGSRGFVQIMVSTDRSFYAVDTVCRLSLITQNQNKKMESIKDVIKISLVEENIQQAPGIGMGKEEKKWVVWSEDVPFDGHTMGKEIEIPMKKTWPSVETPNKLLVIRHHVSVKLVGLDWELKLPITVLPKVPEDEGLVNVTDEERDAAVRMSQPKKEPWDKVKYSRQQLSRLSLAILDDKQLSTVLEQEQDDVPQPSSPRRLLRRLSNADMKFPRKTPKTTEEGETPAVSFAAPGGDKPAQLRSAAMIRTTSRKRLTHRRGLSLDARMLSSLMN